MIYLALILEKKETTLLLTFSAIKKVGYRVLIIAKNSQKNPQKNPQKFPNGFKTLENSLKLLDYWLYKK